MFKAVIFSILYLASFSLMAQSRPIYTPSAKGLNPKSYRLDIKGSYHPTSALYNFNGEKVNLTEGEAYSMMEATVGLGYGIGKKLDVYLDARSRAVDSTYSNGTETIKTQNSGIESFSGMFKYSFEPTDSTQWAMDFSYRQTSYEQRFYASLGDIPDTELILGDAGQEYSLGIHGSYKRNKGHYLNSILRYTVPANDLSSELQYRVESAWLWSRLGLILGVQGVKSLSSDSFGSDPQNKPLQATGASARYNSVNREKVEPYIGINWGFKKWRLETEVGQTISGVSTDHGQYFSLGVVYITSGLSDETFKIESFKEYVIDSTIIKVSPRGKFIKIDQGISSDVEKGMKFDIFQTDYFGENILVASGVAYEVNADSSVIKVVKKYKNMPIKKGFAARGY